MVLFELAENCEYGALRDEMIRDRIVVGIRDSSLSERLQLDPELSLGKAKKAVRQREAVHEQNKTLTAGSTTSGDIAALQPGKSYRSQRPRTGFKGRKRNAGFNSAPKTACTRCGKEPHSRDNCPAKDAICIKCKKKGHYAAVCCTQASVTSELTASPADADVAFLDHLTLDNRKRHG